ncbi:MAG: hypothetical protein HYV02_07665 [Deltaproteobacteria bacterium]|nr:hypothetical protein [Deltaproteobacteria bacterium]
MRDHQYVLGIVCMVAMALGSLATGGCGGGAIDYSDPLAEAPPPSAGGIIGEEAKEPAMDGSLPLTAPIISPDVPTLNALGNVSASVVETTAPPTVPPKKGLYEYLPATIDLLAQLSVNDVQGLVKTYGQSLPDNAGAVAKAAFQLVPEGTTMIVSGMRLAREYGVQHAPGAIRKDDINIDTTVMQSLLNQDPPRDAPVEEKARQSLATAANVGPLNIANNADVSRASGPRSTAHAERGTPRETPTDERAQKTPSEPFDYVALVLGRDEGTYTVAALESAFATVAQSATWETKSIDGQELFEHAGPNGKLTRGFLATPSVIVLLRGDQALLDAYAKEKGLTADAPIVQKMLSLPASVRAVIQLASIKQLPESAYTAVRDTAEALPAMAAFIDQGLGLGGGLDLQSGLGTMVRFWHGNDVGIEVETTLSSKVLDAVFSSLATIVEQMKAGPQKDAVRDEAERPPTIAAVLFDNNGMAIADGTLKVVPTSECAAYARIVGDEAAMAELTDWDIEISRRGDESDVQHYDIVPKTEGDVTKACLASPIFCGPTGVVSLLASTGPFTVRLSYDCGNPERCVTPAGGIGAVACE